MRSCGMKPRALLTRVPIFQETALFAPVPEILSRAPPPSLTDTLSDLERIYRELRRTVTPFQVLRLRAHFSCLWGLAAKLRHHNWKMTATIHLRDLDAPTIRSVEGGDASKQNYGVAIDVGTTTIVAQLIDLSTGAVVGVEASQTGRFIMVRMLFRA